MSTDTIAASQLRAFVERIERLEAEIKEINADKSEIYKELRGCGFDVKAVRQCVAARKLDSAERQERDAIFDLYWEALTGASRVHVHEEQNSHGVGGDNDDRRLIEDQGETGMVPVTGRERPMLRPEAASTEARFESASLHHSQAKASEDNGRTSAIEGAPVTGEASRASVGAGTDASISDDNVPTFLLKERKPLRPLCLNPSECAGYGTHTCHSCLKAAGKTEVAA